MRSRFSLLIILMLITLSCNPFSETPAPTISPLPSPHIPPSSPTPDVLREGEAFSTDNLALTVIKHRLEGCYTSESGNEICPDPGAALLWIHLKRENQGDTSDLPIYSCFWFHLLYRGEELDSLWYSGYGDYHPERHSWIGGGCEELYAGYSDEGWIVFKVPEGIVFEEAVLRIESYQGPEFAQIWKLTD